VSGDFTGVVLIRVVKLLWATKKDGIFKGTDSNGCASSSDRSLG
jgi:hypothetical protein